jgi:hypothetical protein
MSRLGKMRMLSDLEGIVSKYILNNDSPIRYPITSDDGIKMKNRDTKLDVNELEWEELMGCNYTFGAKKLYIYAALDAIIDYLNKELLEHDIPPLEALCDYLEPD